MLGSVSQELKIPPAEFERELIPGEACYVIANDKKWQNCIRQKFDLSKMATMALNLNECLLQGPSTELIWCMYIVAVNINETLYLKDQLMYVHVLNSF